MASSINSIITQLAAAEPTKYPALSSNSSTEGVGSMLSIATPDRLTIYSGEVRFVPIDVNKPYIATLTLMGIKTSRVVGNNPITDVSANVGFDNWELENCNAFFYGTIYQMYAPVPVLQLNAEDGIVFWNDTFGGPFSLSVFDNAELTGDPLLVATTDGLQITVAELAQEVPGTYYVVATNNTNDNSLSNTLEITYAD